MDLIFSSLLPPKLPQIQFTKRSYHAEVDAAGAIVQMRQVVVKVGEVIADSDLECFSDITTDFNEEALAIVFGFFLIHFWLL